MKVLNRTSAVTYFFLFSFFISVFSAGSVSASLSVYSQNIGDERSQLIDNNSNSNAQYGLQPINIPIKIEKKLKNAGNVYLHMMNKSIRKTESRTPVAKKYRNQPHPHSQSLPLLPSLIYDPNLNPILNASVNSNLIPNFNRSLNQNNNQNNNQNQNQYQNIDQNAIKMLNCSSDSRGSTRHNSSGDKRPYSILGPVSLSTPDYLPTMPFNSNNGDNRINSAEQLLIEEELSHSVFDENSINGIDLENDNDTEIDNNENYSNYDNNYSNSYENNDQNNYQNNYEILNETENEECASTRSLVLDDSESSVGGYSNSQGGFSHSHSDI